MKTLIFNHQCTDQGISYDPQYSASGMFSLTTRVAFFETKLMRGAPAIHHHSV